MLLLYFGWSLVSKKLVCLLVMDYVSKHTSKYTYMLLFIIDFIMYCVKYNYGLDSIWV